MQPYGMRIAAIQKQMMAQQVSHLILGPSANLFYLTGLSPMPDERLQLLVIPAQGEPALVLPELYRTMVEVPEAEARPGNPGFGWDFGQASRLRWRRETIMVEPKENCTQQDIYRYLYAAIRDGVPFPVKMEEALEVVRVTEMIRQRAAGR